MQKHLHNQPKFSFMMCVYNDTSLLADAVESLREQSFSDWELVILDNSNKNEDAWNILLDYEQKEKRIHIYKSENNVGWAKGASILLEKIHGEYTTFLSADDRIAPNALEILNDVTNKEHPDIVFIGNDYWDYHKQTHEFILLGGNLPEYKRYDTQNRSAAIYEIMKNIYYNSMFHYSRTAFLKENGINFFNPYYGDNGSMTKAIEKAKTIITLDQKLYHLTMNTSQTSGHYVWKQFELFSARQWDCAKEIFRRENFIDFDKIFFVNYRIIRNALSGISALGNGACRDSYMNPFNVDFPERVLELEDMLENQQMLEMLLLGDDIVFKMLLDYLLKFAKSFQKAGVYDLLKKSRLSDLFFLAEHQDSLSPVETMKILYTFLMREDNKMCLGLSYFIKISEKCSDTEIIEVSTEVRKVIEKYNMLLETLDDPWLAQVLPY